MLCDPKVTCYALTTELWLPETFVIILFVKVASETECRSLYGLSGKFISALPTVPIMRHVWDL